MTGNSRIYCRIAIVVLVIASAAVHAFIAQSTFGFEFDVRTFAVWGRRLADVGPMAFYAHDYWCDYPPGYIMVAGLLHQIADMLNANEGTALWLIIVKAPACLCDCATGWLVWRIASRALSDMRHGEAWALAAAACYLFNPAALVDSALWGQVDGVLSFFVVAMFACYLRAFDVRQNACAERGKQAESERCESNGPGAQCGRDGRAEGERGARGARGEHGARGACGEQGHNGKPDMRIVAWMVAGSVLWAIGITMKLQGALIAPAVLFVFLMLIRRSPRTGLVSLVASFLAALLVAVAVLLPFSTAIGVQALLLNFLETLGSYQFGSVNALNFFTMVGAGWADQELPFLFLTYHAWGTIFLVLLVAFTVACYVRAEWIDRLRLALFGHSIASLGARRSSADSPGSKKVPILLSSGLVALPVLLAAVLVVGFFTFSVRVHERYIFYAIALLLVAAVMYRDKRLINVFVMVSIIEMVNLVMVFNGAYFFGHTAFEVAASALMVATCVYLFVRTWQLSKPRAR